MTDYLKDSPYLKRLMDTAKEVITEHRCIYCGERFPEYDLASSHVIECREKNSVVIYKIEYSYDLDGSHPNGYIHSATKIRIPRARLKEYLDKRESEIHYGNVGVTIYTEDDSPSSIQRVLEECKREVQKKILGVSEKAENIDTSTSIVWSFINRIFKR